MNPNGSPEICASLLRIAETERLEQVEKKLLGLPQIDCPLNHRFTPGIYARECYLPAVEGGTIVIGHQHKTKHLNFVMAGKVLVMMDGKIKLVVGPDVFESEAGVRKVLLVLEDTWWVTTHATEETDLAKLEELLIIKSDAFMDHRLKEDAEKLRLAAESIKNADA